MSDTTWTEDHYPKRVVGLLGGFGGLRKRPKCFHAVYEALVLVVLEKVFGTANSLDVHRKPVLVKLL